MMEVLRTVGIIILVVLLFNFMIFFHELGHFLAGKWRGAYIDRFQIWFGRPIWKKKINGVLWGIGWIPAGGFVSLPQLESMEGIEGKADIPGNLKPLKPLDKVIIAAAGPFFSLLLAYIFAMVVWGIGKPVTELPGTRVGYVQPDSPAAVAGVLPGDEILAVDGKIATKWSSGMEGVRELIALSERPTIELTVRRPGVAAPFKLNCGYTQADTQWWQRSAMRRIGVMPALSVAVGEVIPGSPAAKANLRPGQQVTHLNGTPIYSPLPLQLASAEGKPLRLSLTNPAAEVSLTPEIPANWKGLPGAEPILGLLWANPFSSIRMEYPSPQEQVNMSARWMKDTFEKLCSPGSSVSVEHLSGPVGIVSYFYKMMENGGGAGLRLVLWFSVVLNVNLAILNILPLPVVDGGHVILGIIEAIRRKPVSGQFLNWIFSVFIFLLLALFVFITFKDVGDIISGGSSANAQQQLPAPEF